MDHVTSQLETDDLPNANRDIVLYPASDEDLTDEDSEWEEDTGEIGMDNNHHGAGILCQRAEVYYNDNNDDIQEVKVWMKC